MYGQVFHIFLQDLIIMNTLGEYLLIAQESQSVVGNRPQALFRLADTDPFLVREKLFQGVERACQRFLIRCTPLQASSLCCRHLSRFIALDDHLGHGICYTHSSEHAAADLARGIQPGNARAHVGVDMNAAHAVLTAEADLQPTILLCQIAICINIFAMIVTVSVESLEMLYHRFKHGVNLFIGEPIEIKVEATVLRCALRIVQDTAIVVHIQNLAHFTDGLHLFHLVRHYDQIAFCVHRIVVKRRTESAKRRKNGSFDFIRFQCRDHEKHEFHVRKLCACAIGHRLSVAR